MNLTETRAALAGEIEAAVAGTKWFPKRPTGIRDRSGWLVLTEISSAGSTFATLQASFNAVLALGTDLDHAQAQIDDLIVPLHDAVASTGRCWGLKVIPDSVTIGGSEYFVLTATFLTEIEAT